jgi:hypothetical protein
MQIVWKSVVKSKDKIKTISQKILDARIIHRILRDKSG